jgi:hypothetical protein
VQRLAEIQSDVREAVVSGDEARIASLLTGGKNPLKRLQIHHRQYETSLVTALLGKYPATVWLVGSPFVTEAARHYVRENPPHKPCIAEYGDGFPEFLSTRPDAARIPYLRDFAELEWHIGNVSIAADQPPIGAAEFLSVPADALPYIVLRLQSGLRYLHASWPVDELMKLFLTDTAPDTLEFEPAEVWIEVRGSRGEIRMDRLGQAEFLFRKAVREGRSLGDASAEALGVDDGFEPAPTVLIANGAVTGMKLGKQERQ